jgi:hypothetical protein
MPIMLLLPNTEALHLPALPLHLQVSDHRPVAAAFLLEAHRQVMPPQRMPPWLHAIC